jgi:hypothetical protein
VPPRCGVGRAARRGTLRTLVGGILILVFILVIGPLSLLYGVDSRVYEERPRGWWPAAPRR